MRLTEEKTILNYLEKTSKHLFKRYSTDDVNEIFATLFKILPLKIDGKYNILKLTFNGDKIIIMNIMDIEIFSRFDSIYYDSLKYTMFPPYEGKVEAIKHFKKVRSFIGSIKSEYDCKEDVKSDIHKIFEENK